jgi:hypothetical protein
LNANRLTIDQATSSPNNFERPDFLLCLLSEIYNRVSCSSGTKVITIIELMSKKATAQDTRDSGPVTPNLHTIYQTLCRGNS